MSEQFAVYLALPNAGSIMPCAFTGAVEASARHKLGIKPLQFGDIPHNFNMMWCEALQGRANGLTHFAMLHTDIGPQTGWIDILIDEMEATGADIMSAVVAIKDERGLTTTGIRYPGVWGTRRFTMTEIMALPETFSIADTDEPDAILAINTGCWVCRLPQGGWPDKFPGFQNEHKIVWRSGEPTPMFDSEDWLFSAWAASQGLKVFATRKVLTMHQGAFGFTNNRAWGSWKTEYQAPSRPLSRPIPDPGITVETEYPVAVDSLDHTQPLGAAVDNSKSAAFNAKLFELVPAAEVRLLDLGCSGGGLVRSILEAGGFAVGIEGSDYSFRRQRAEWGTIPNHLFTADATKPFTIRNCTPEPIKFNVITGWEFFEHIAEEDIPAVVENIHRHSANTCYFIGSISTNQEPHHRTARSQDWWIKMLDSLGIILLDDTTELFGNDWVRTGDPKSFSGVYAVDKSAIDD